MVNAKYVLQEKLEFQKELDEYINNLHLERELKEFVSEQLIKKKKTLSNEIHKLQNYLDGIFKAGDYLTDGRSIIKIGYVREPDWTPSNNYGRKWHEYSSCSYYGDEKFELPVFSGNRRDVKGEITAMWFAEGWHLSEFIPIDKKLIRDEILKQLE